MKNKITLFIGSLTGGGAEKVTCNLANFLYNKGYDVTVINMIDVKDSYLLNNNIKRYFLLKQCERKNVIFDYFLRIKRLKKFLNENKDIDCIITMLPITILLMTLLRKQTKAKLIISERNNPSTYKIYEKIIMKFSQRRCDGLVVQTSEIGEWYKKSKSIAIIPNALNDEKMLEFNSTARLKEIVAVGRLENQKNYPMLIEAFSKLNDKIPDYKLIIYGEGHLKKKLAKMVSKYGLTQKVVFKGYVKNVIDCIKNSKVYIMTSNYEGMPNSLIEAMAIGIPCISTDCDGGGAKFLLQNDNGFLIKKNDIPDLIDKVMILLENEKVYDKFINNSRIFLKKLNYNTIYSNWENYIIKIINS